MKWRLLVCFDNDDYKDDDDYVMMMMMMRTTMTAMAKKIQTNTKDDKDKDFFLVNYFFKNTG